MRREERGQATVELVALLPLALVLGLAVATLLAARGAALDASSAARAGAIALIRGVDARAAARTALPRPARARSRIRVDGRSVTVSVRPATPVPFLRGRLTARATAHAGPEPAP